MLFDIFGSMGFRPRLTDLALTWELRCKTSRITSSSAAASERNRAHPLLAPITSSARLPRFQGRARLHPANRRYFFSSLA